MFDNKLSTYNSKDYTPYDANQSRVDHLFNSERWIGKDNLLDKNQESEITFIAKTNINDEESKIIATFDNPRDEIVYINTKVNRPLEPGKRIVIREEGITKETDDNSLALRRLKFGLINDKDTQSDSFDSNANNKFYQCFLEATAQNLLLINKIKELEEMLTNKTQECEALKKTNEYLNDELNINEKSKEGNIIDKSIKKDDCCMKRSLIAFPLLTISQIQKQWDNFIEIHTFKAFFIFICGIFTTICGSNESINSAVFILSIVHFITRYMANRYRAVNDYVNFSRQLQLFLWPYILLAVGNVLNGVIAINVLPPNSFYGIFAAGVLWLEVKGIVENAKTAKLPVPLILEKVVLNGKGNDLPL